MRRWPVCDADGNYWPDGRCAGLSSGMEAGRESLRALG